jgi:uncharacterized protein YycO
MCGDRVSFPYTYKLGKRAATISTGRAPEPGLAQLGLVRTPGFTSWLTRVATRSPYNHIVAYVGEGKVISCQPTGVTEMPLEDFPDVVWSNFDLTLAQTGEVINFLHDQLGKPYDDLMYVWCGVARVLEVPNTPKWVLRRLASMRAWICSQLTDAAYQTAGKHLFKDHRANGAVVPADYVPIWREHGWIRLQCTSSAGT